ncbi:hypothetical protein [Pseudovibrio sp. POLY-S9]|uniref:hypothetical protein n=1 Tax=Pseudovibrio sp. POLY-S9 TaxID=1576596 RepID=UPI00070B84DA|nr:hypothetical protein [Pseudovibrio sp. POLY-S9]
MGDLSAVWNEARQWLVGDGAAISAAITITTFVAGFFIVKRRARKQVNVRADRGSIAAGRDISIGDNIKNTSSKDSSNDE